MRGMCKKGEAKDMGLGYRRVRPAAQHFFALQTGGQEEPGVLVLGTGQRQPYETLLGRARRTERVRESGELPARLCFALQLSATVLVIGGFGGDPWPGMPEICKALSASAGVDENDVQFRWVKGGDVPLGAEFYARGKTVYAISAVPEHAAQMLHYLGGKLAQLSAQRLVPRAAEIPGVESPEKARESLLIAEGAKREGLFRMAAAAALALAAAVFVASGVYLVLFLS